MNTPVVLVQGQELYNSRNMASSCESVRPRLLYNLIFVRKEDNSSNIPSNLPPLSDISAPIFSNVASVKSQDGSVSDNKTFVGLNLDHIVTFALRFSSNIVQQSLEKLIDCCFPAPCWHTDG